MSKCDYSYKPQTRQCQKMTGNHSVYTRASIMLLITFFFLNLYLQNLRSMLSSFSPNAVSSTILFSSEILQCLHLIRFSLVAPYCSTVPASGGFLCGVCVFFLCTHEFPPTIQAHAVRSIVDSKIAWRCECEHERLPVLFCPHTV